MNTINHFIEFLFDYREELVELTFEHIELTIMSLTIAMAIGLPIGILLTRYKKISDPVLGIIGVIQTIPSVALLGLLLPLLGIGPVPAIVALFLYALLPLVRNTFTGIIEVEESVKEAAKGMGMSNLQVLTKVELPLAIPVIFAGIRTATVINVGIATLCALIAAGGLGEFIFRGIQLNNTNMILAGAIPAAILALTFDFVLGVMQTFIRKIIKPALIGFALIVFIALPFYVIPSVFSRPFLAGFVHEFVERDDGYKGLRKIYGFNVTIKELESGLMFQALESKKVDVISGYSTDGRITTFNFKILDDDKHVFPPYYAAPYIKGSTLRKYPELKDVFSKVAWKLNDGKMARLNFLTEYKQTRAKDVAKEFLNSLGLKTNIERKTNNPHIVIGSKNFTEQYVLAELFSILIENYTDLDVELKKGLAGTKVCFDALKKGEIDIYPEYTGTALFVLLKTPRDIIDKLIVDEETVYNYVKSESKKRFDTEWLEPLGFNNTWALIMRKEHADKLGINTISDLKNYLDSTNL
ncbi:MAG: ABC transporter permease/substrate-binding protein [Candidatus Melainabacteria bacterium]|nr:ABC transporter permease/substrate-binding protein [Candidatus Melainabacteria bacterium]